MPSLLQRYATPFITGLFLVSLISGLALFFHVGQAHFHGMHEWLSLLLVVPFLLHIWKNWKPLTNYFRKPAFAVAIALSAVMAVPFVLQAGTAGGGRPPIFALSHTLLANSAAELAPLLGSTPEALLTALEEEGFAAAAPEMALTDIAARSGKSEMDLAAALNSLAK